MAHYNTHLYESQFDADQHLYWQQQIKEGYEYIQKISDNLDEVQSGTQRFQTLVEKEISDSNNAINTIGMNLEHYEDDDSDYANTLRTLQHPFHTIYEQLIEINDVIIDINSKTEKLAKKFNREHHLREMKLHESFLNKFHFVENDPFANEHSDVATNLATALEELKIQAKENNEFVIETELNLHVQNKKFIHLQDQIKEIKKEIFFEG